MTTAAIIASIGLSAGSQVLGGIAENRAAQYRAKVATMNQQIAEDNAARAINKSQIDAQDQDALTLAALGELTAEQGASGISIGSKSFGAVRKTVARLGRKDALNVRHAGKLAAYNFRTDAVNFGSEAQLNKMSGRNSLVQGFLGGAQSLVSGATKVRGSRQRAGTTNNPNLGIMR